jgi:site-specific recombinase XerD
MGRYPFITGITEFLKKDGDYYEEITRRSYDRKLRFFGKIFEDLKKEGKVSSTNPKTITEDDIYAFVGTRVKDGIKPDTILHDLSTLRLFLMNFGNNAVEKYKIKYRTRVPRAHHERREALSEDVAIKIFKRAKTIDEDSWRLIEAYSLVSVAISTGLRPGELRKLYRHNVRKDEDGYIIHAVHVKR